VKRLIIRAHSTPLVLLVGQRTVRGHEERFPAFQTNTMETSDDLTAPIALDRPHPGDMMNQDPVAHKMAYSYQVASQCFQVITLTNQRHMNAMTQASSH
jgi:hypothetical protein